MNCYSLRISILIHIVHNFPNHEKCAESMRQEVVSCFVQLAAESERGS